MRVKLTVLISMLMSICLLLGMNGQETKTPEITGYNQSLLNVCDYGAIPNDGKDDTLAFQLSLSIDNSPVYVPPGTYDITDSLIVHDANLIGSGVDKTVIVADTPSVRDPIIWVGQHSQIRDLTIKFADHCVNGTEISGERVGIVTTSKGKGSFIKCGSISNVKIQNVGTGVYIPLKTVYEKYKPAGQDRWGSGQAFSITFENISVIDFSFRGISAESNNRTGNVWRNIYLSSGKYEANTAFYTTREESESSITELTVANSKLKNALRFDESYGIQLTNLNIINTELTHDNTAFLYCDESNVIINGLTVENSVPQGNLQSFIRLGDASYRGQYYYPTNGYLIIHNMNIINQNKDLFVDPSQYMIARSNEYLCDYTVDIENFRVLAPSGVKEIYEQFNYDKRGILLTVSGEKK